MSRPRCRADWIRLIGAYPVETVLEMWRQLVPEVPRPGGLKPMAKELAAVHQEGSRIRVRFGALSSAQQIVLHLAMEWADEGMPAPVALAELERRLSQSAELSLRALVETGCLLAAGAGDAGKLVGVRSYDFRGPRPPRLVLHPALDELASGVTMTGEASSWSRLARRLSAVELTSSWSPHAVIEALGAVCRVVDAQPRLLTTSGALRVPARRRVEAMFKGLGTDLDFISWLHLAWWTRLVTADEDDQVWQRGPAAVKLVSEPLAVLAPLPGLLRSVCPTVLPLARGWPAAAASVLAPLRGDPGGLGARAADVAITAIAEASSGFLDPGAWFADDELHPLLNRLARQWDAEVWSARAWWWAAAHPETTGDSLHALLAHLLDVLAGLAILERGRAGKVRASRLTRLGARLLEAAAGEPDRDWGQAYERRLHMAGGLDWQGEHLLVVSDETDAELVALALGSLAEPVTAQSAFRVDRGTIERTLQAGEPATEIAERLAGLVPGQDPPAAVRAGLEQAARSFRPVVVHTDVVAVQAPGLTDKHRDGLRAMALDVVDDLVLALPEHVEQVMKKLGLISVESINYDVRPRCACRLDKDLVLTLPDGFADLRLVQLLDELGIASGVCSVRLDLEAIPGAQTMDERGVARLLKGLLRRLEPHLVKGVPPAARTRLMAAAGVVDAPQVDDCVLLTFDAETAKGLIQLGALGKSARSLRDGQLLLPRAALAAAEEALSELGIPFPAEHSSLRAAARAQLAVGRLEQALAEVESETGANPGPAAERQPGRPRRRRRRPDPALEQTALDAIRQACAGDGQGARLGELAAAIGLDRQTLRPALRSLVRDGRVTLSGHARGARYRIA